MSCSVPTVQQTKRSKQIINIIMPESRTQGINGHHSCNSVLRLAALIYYTAFLYCFAACPYTELQKSKNEAVVLILVHIITWVQNILYLNIFRSPSYHLSIPVVGVTQNSQ